ncbi:unknown [Singapore grouper iridovirus]|uniref:Ig-like domain-containing protein n=1 Tax=Singapore grouper iridovirus TaxID=262968 RepID=Q5YFN5_9VIRU|nr:hypothetical protein ORF030L [Singapore grouper iridovirus]AAS18045.1 unknown [Singapore grouper iridovirus]WAU86739.1 hypothetical protein ORF030L [Singapore grouper iridovirus]
MAIIVLLSLLITCVTCTVYHVTCDEGFPCKLNCKIPRGVSVKSIIWKRTLTSNTDVVFTYTKKGPIHSQNNTIPHVLVADIKDFFNIDNCVLELINPKLKDDDGGYDCSYATYKSHVTITSYVKVRESITKLSLSVSEKTLTYTARIRMGDPVMSCDNNVSPKTSVRKDSESYRILTATVNEPTSLQYNISCVLTTGGAQRRTIFVQRLTHVKVDDNHDGFLNISCFNDSLFGNVVWYRGTDLVAKNGSSLPEWGSVFKLFSDGTLRAALGKHMQTYTCIDGANLVKTVVNTTIAFGERSHKRSSVSNVIVLCFGILVTLGIIAFVIKTRRDRKRQDTSDA